MSESLYTMHYCTMLLGPLYFILYDVVVCAPADSYKASPKRHPTPHTSSSRSSRSSSRNSTQIYIIYYYKLLPYSMLHYSIIEHNS